MRRSFPWETVKEWFDSKSNPLCNGSTLSLLGSSETLVKCFSTSSVFSVSLYVSHPSLDIIRWMRVQVEKSLQTVGRRASPLLFSSFSGLKSSVVCEKDSAKLFYSSSGDRRGNLGLSVAMTV